MDNEFVQSFFRYQLSGNWFRDFNPLSKLNILFAFAFSALVIGDYRYGLSLCLFYFIFSIVCGRLKYFVSLFSKLIVIIGLFIVVIRQLTVRGNIVIFDLFGWKWTWEGLENGLNMASVILGFSGAIIIFYATTAMRDLMYSLEQKGVSHTTSYVMLASFQTIIDLKRSVETIMESQKSRGIETEGNIIQRAKAFMPIISPLLLGAIASTEEKSIAMDARAFSVEKKHTFLRELRPVPTYEKIVVIGCDLYFLAVCAWRIYVTFLS